MDWSVVFVLIAFAAVLQLAFFWYYLRSGGQADSPYPTVTGESGENTPASGTNQHSATNSQPQDEALITCQECGHENHWDQVFTYCANCVTQLG